MQDNELFKKKRRPFSPETVDSRRKRAPLLITWHYSTGQGQCQMKISAKGREVLLRPSHPLGPKPRGGRVYAEAGRRIGVCRTPWLSLWESSHGGNAVTERVAMLKAIIRIPSLVPSQSCCARQLPQRGSQGDILANPDLPLPALLDITPRLYYTYPMKFRCIRNEGGAAHESAAEKRPA